jgi:hypothetical protein
MVLGVCGLGLRVYRFLLEVGDFATQFSESRKTGEQSFSIAECSV